MLTWVWVWRRLLQRHKRNSLLLFSVKFWGKRGQHFLNLDCSSSAIHKVLYMSIKAKDRSCDVSWRSAVLHWLFSATLFCSRLKTPIKWQHPPLSSVPHLCPRLWPVASVVWPGSGCRFLLSQQWWGACWSLLWCQLSGHVIKELQQPQPVTNGRFLLTELICFPLLGSSAFDTKWTSSVLETCLTLWGLWTENRPFYWH